MALDNTTSLAIAELVLYILIVPLVLYSAFKHGRAGFLGWAFLFVFCLLRLTYDGMQISNHSKQEKGESTSNTADILNQIGLSALLLADSGIIHEASHQTPHYTAKRALVLQILVHVFTTGGIALAAVGGSNLAKPESPSNRYSKDNALRELGSVILFLVCVGMLIYALFTRRSLKRGVCGRNATWLATATIGAAAFTLLRGVYSLIYAFDHLPKVNPATGDFGLRFALVFLVQLLATICLVVGGVVARGIKIEGGARSAQQGSVTRRAEGGGRGAGVGNADGLVLGQMGRDAQLRFKEQGQVLV